MLIAYPASTVVVCRITKEWPHKILLIKRSEKAAFLPGAYVFPGGRVEKCDEEMGELFIKDEKNLARIEQYFSPKAAVLSYLAAAIRETFEETGFSIARSLASALLIDAPSLKRLMKGKDLLSLSLETIWPISWWITPPGETRRFDTLFFLALINDGEYLDYPRKSEGIADYQWLTPKEAVLAYENRQIFLPPPTRSILERLAQTSSLKDFLCYVDKPLQPIRPHFIDGADGNKVLVLPGDEAHEEKIRPRMLMRTRYTFR